MKYFNSARFTNELINGTDDNISALMVKELAKGIIASLPLDELLKVFDLVEYYHETPYSEIPGELFDKYRLLKEQRLNEYQLSIEIK